ncbi:cutinase [Pseudozyma hubeiensis SY62]|uniref:cutinase n=1 Tax=Pseudozyma hubeiensis (strain SY62) TaxID=1305764 RepID=R9P014_PSEHS|nr:cutinase [Pseudozyma hubeiensis SY62]GAC94317.1 cutinase [Pseudozyma hubeiensis SY62]
MGSMLGGGGDGGGDATAAAGGCPPLQLIFARGTTEIQGTLGIVGRPLCTGLQQQVPGTQCYDVVYSSDTDYFVAPSQGAAAATSEMNSISSRCPSTKFVLGGYSKGAMVVHLIKQANNVVGAVTFGDPYKMMPVPTTPNWKLFCHMGDPVCENGMNVMAHLTYSMEDINAAVSFLVQAYRCDKLRIGIRKSVRAECKIRQVRMRRDRASSVTKATKP